MKHKPLGLILIITAACLIGEFTALPLMGNHQTKYYANSNLMTVERDSRIIDYLPCERISLDYPGLKDRCDVNIGRDSNGDIWAAITGTPTNTMERLFQSQDGGRSWSSIPMAPTLTNEFVAFTVLNNNAMLLATRPSNHTITIHRSTDMGKTWTVASTIEAAPHQYIGEGFLSLTQKKDGEILFPVCRYNDDPYVTEVNGGVFASATHGSSFPTLHLTGKFWMECHILELQSGNLLMAIRYQRTRNSTDTDESILSLGGSISPNHDFAFKHIFLADSEDGGATWSNFRPIRDSQGHFLMEYGQCHGQLIQLNDGRVVLVYDNRYESEERDVRARVSLDNGKTWEPETYYVSFGRGDPASVVLDDDTIVTVTGNWSYGPSGPIGSPTAQVIRWKLPPVEATASLRVNPTQLTFGAIPNVSTSSPQEIDIIKEGTGALNWSVAEDAAWLSCAPVTGTDSGVFTVTVHPEGLSPGTYNAVITVSAPNAAGSPVEIPVTFHVYNPGQTPSAFGSFDSPLPQAMVSGSVAFTGWALDSVGIKDVKIYREEGSSLVYIGDAVFVNGARPDVEQAYPGYPQNNRAGWGYLMLTHFLPGGNGTFTFHAIATNLQGTPVTLGTRTITVDNAHAALPFGTIETPVQGGTASGKNFMVWGWALTPLPHSIPNDGSTIRVLVDGIDIGHPVYNLYRSDIAALFPSYINSSGAVGYFILDTTAYANGLHTIQWTVTDDAGNTDGIGSRYFTIKN
ncbi:MAG: exo-alpha-sialidase [Candidatus Omnitrophota bacterium]